jgi:hypothetical protein
MPKKAIQPNDAADEHRQLSLAQQIADLDIGKSVSMAERHDGDAATKDVITDTRVRMRNLVAAAVKRAKDRTGATYTVESGEISTRTLDLLVVLVITRLS